MLYHSDVAVACGSIVIWMVSLVVCGQERWNAIGSVTGKGVGGGSEEMGNMDVTGPYMYLCLWLVPMTSKVQRFRSEGLDSVEL